jgi:hypothetical protein
MTTFLKINFFGLTFLALLVLIGFFNIDASAQSNSPRGLTRQTYRSPEQLPNPVPIDPSRRGRVDYPDRSGYAISRSLGDGYLTAYFNGQDQLTHVMNWDSNKNPRDGGFYTANNLSKPEAQQAIDSVFGQGTYEELERIDREQGTQGLPPPGKAENDCIEWPYWNSFQVNPEICIARFVTNPMLWVSSKILWFAGLAFNYTVNFSINMGAIMEQLKVVDIGWKILRDIANICFIFILLALAIGTILKVDNYDAKKLLARVIIVAILLNFSLFFTKVIIDSSNILALQFYSRIAPRAQPGSINDGGIADGMLRGLKLDTLVQDKAGDAAPEQNLSANGGVWQGVIMMGLGGSALMIITAFVFLVATILFIIRIVVLAMLMILAPLAFLAAVLPQTKGYFDKWTSTLLNQSFFAPIFMLLIYIVFAAIASNPSGGSMNDLLLGKSSAIGVLFNYILLIGLMLGSLIISKQLGAYGGDVARNIAGKATFGLTGRVGRATVGRAARSMQDSAWAKRLASGRITGALGGRALERGLGNVAGKSFDFRNTSAAKGLGGVTGGFGEGSGKGGFTKSVEERKKSLEEQKKRVEGRSIKEEQKLFAAENDKKATEALRAAALLRERDEAEKNRKNAEDHKETVLKPLIDQEVAAANARIEQLETRKKTTQDAHDKVKADLERERIAEVAKMVDPSLTTTDRTRAQAEVARIDAEINDKQKQHDELQASIDEKIGEKRKDIGDFEAELGAADEEIAKFAGDMEKADKLLNSMNKDYKVGGSAAENYRVVKSIKDNAKGAQKYAQANGFDDTTSSMRLAHHGEFVQKTRIDPINNTTKARGESYAKPGIIDNAAAKIGVTTGQMAMVRGIRDGGRKNKKDKVLDDLKKVMKEEGMLDEVKEEGKKEVRKESKKEVERRSEEKDK